MAESVQSRRPKLSLQTKPIQHGPGIRSKNTFANADPKSLTAFNTLSNVYVTAIERSTPTQSTPLTAIRLQQPLKLRTDPDTLQNHQSKIQITHTELPTTPPSANPMSPAQQMDIVYPSSMTPTPPMSAGSVDSGNRVFTFSPMDTHRQSLLSPPVRSQRRVSFVSLDSVVKAPYSHNKSLHSILRNSPLQSANAKSPGALRRQSVRIQERTTRRVGYESPLTRTIITEKYTKSHIDLLVEEASPYTPSPLPEDSDIDLTMAYSGDEIKDGGLTPGPFEETRRQMTSLGTESSVTSVKPDGIRKRKRKEKKRKWVWTIGRDDEETEGGVSAAVAAAAIRAAAGEACKPMATTSATPAMSVEAAHIHGVESEYSPAVGVDDDGMSVDTESSETSSLHTSRETTPTGGGSDSKVPTADDQASHAPSPAKRPRLSLFCSTSPEPSNHQERPKPQGIIAEAGPI